MIIEKCSHCQGLMKIDETKLPEGKDGMVRCPQCREILWIDEESRSLRPMSSESGSQAEPLETNGSDAPQDGEQEFASYTVPADHDTEDSLPEDSSDDFLFPAELGPGPSQKKATSLRFKVALWSIISVAVIAFFALLVNLVLPGPPESGKVPVVHRTEEATPGLKGTAKE